MTKQQIKCPNCDTSIDVSEVLLHQLQDQVKQEYAGKLATLEKQQKKLDDAISEGVKKKLQAEKSALEKKLRAEIGGENAEAIRSLEEQLGKKSGELKQMNKLKAELLQTKQEKEELESKIYVEAAEKFNRQLQEEKNKIKGQAEKDMEFKIAEKDITIEKLLEQTKDMQKRLERGAISQQLQGEAMEISIEKYLKMQFPLDDVNEIKKGVNGADTLVTVNTHTRKNCGLIYYESKRTQNFSEAWIPKFKDDIREKGALIGVLVSDIMPDDMPRLGLRDGVWVCSYEEFKGLCFALREAVIMYSEALLSQENKADKMVMLYDFLTGVEFKMCIEAIVEGFSQMEHDLVSERRSMEGIWKKREKQLQKVLSSTISLYSSVRGIAGSAIAPIQALELPAANEKQA